MFHSVWGGRTGPMARVSSLFGIPESLVWNNSQAKKSFKNPYSFLPLTLSHMARGDDHRALEYFRVWQIQNQPSKIDSSLGNKTWNLSDFLQFCKMVGRGASEG